MERIAGHYDKIILTLIMCLVILFMATFTPFAESTKAVGVIAGSVIAILIVGLSAIGITFVTTGAYNTIEEYVESLFIDFCNDNGTTPEILLRGTQSGTDKLGRLILNNKYVVVISTFASWLKAKLNLVDNENLTLQSVGNSIDGMMVYETPLYVYRDITGGQHLCYISISFNGVAVSDIYGIYTTTDDLQVYITKTDYRNTRNLIFKYVDVQTGEVLSETWWNNFSQLIGGYNIAPWYCLSLSYGNNVHPINGVTAYSQEHIGYILSRNTDVDYNPTGISINTGDIAIPLDDDNYTDGDGAIIDLNADWGTTYQDVIEQVIPDDYSDSKEGEASIEYVTEDEATEVVEDTSEISNLPAGTIPFTPLQLPQFNLVDIWHYVAQWISDTAIAAGVLMSIVTQEPSPMVNLFYATVCLAIIFGLIKGIAK